MTNFKSTRTGHNDDDLKCEKCKQFIEAAFGPRKSLTGNSVSVAKRPHSKIVTFEKGKNSERNYNSVYTNIVNTTTPKEGDEKLVQKLETIKDPPLVDAEQKLADEINPFRRLSKWFSDRDMCSTSELRGDFNIFDELAKRCLNTPTTKIDKKIIEEMEKTGIVQPYPQKPSSTPEIEDEIVETSSPRKIRKPRKQQDIELEIRILETIKVPRRNYIYNKRTLRHLAMNLGGSDITVLKKAIQMEPTILETNAATREAPQEHERQYMYSENYNTASFNLPKDEQDKVKRNMNNSKPTEQPDALVNSIQTKTYRHNTDNNLNTETVGVQKLLTINLSGNSETMKRNEALLDTSQILKDKKETSNINAEDVEVPESSQMNKSAILNSIVTEHKNLEDIINYLYQERFQVNSSTATSKDSQDTLAVILSKELADVELKSDKKESPLVSSSTAVSYEHATRSELKDGLDEIRDVFDEEKVPLHPFVDLTNKGYENITQKSKIQDLESGLDLLRPKYSLDDNNTLPSTSMGIGTSNTNESTDSTLTAVTTNVHRNDNLIKPTISSAVVKFNVAAADSASKLEKVKSHVETADPSIQSQTDDKLKFATDKLLKAIDTQSAKIMEESNLQSSNTQMSISELVQKIREKSHSEDCHHVMFNPQVPDAEAGNPPPKSDPPKSCPSQKTEDKKCNPYTKFQINSKLDTFGVLGTKMRLPQEYGFPKQGFDSEQTAEANKAMLDPDQIDFLMEDVRYANFSNRVISQRVMNFLKSNETWGTPFLLVPQKRKK